MNIKKISALLAMFMSINAINVTAEEIIKTNNKYEKINELKLEDEESILEDEESIKIDNENKLDKEEIPDLNDDIINEVLEDNQISKEEDEKIEENEEKNIVISVTINRPSGNINSTGDSYIKGTVSTNGDVSKIEVLSNNKIIGNAILQKDSNNINFEYELKNLQNGNHDINIRIYMKDGSYYTRPVRQINVNQSNKHNINGQASLSKEKMKQILFNNNKNLTSSYVNNFVDLVVKEANDENIRYDIAFAQMMKETNYLKFGGDVKPEQNNFAGIGATGGGNPGNSFPTVEIGIRAVIQHLKAYSSTEPLKKECVDPRFKYVKRGSAVYAQHLGINENPIGAGWATQLNYGYEIMDLVRRIDSLIVSQKSYFTGYRYSGQLNPGENVILDADSDKDALYKFYVMQVDEGKVETIKEYGSEDKVTWKPKKAGKYKVEMWVKNKYSDTKTYDDMVRFEIDIKDIEKSKFTGYRYSGQLSPGGSVILDADSGKDALYKFYVMQVDEGKVETIKEYGSEDKVTWKPKKAGKYKVEMWVKNKYSDTKTYDDMVRFEIDIKDIEKSKFTGYRYSGQLSPGGSVILDADSGKDALYKFYVMQVDEGKVETIKEYGPEDKVTWKPKKAGKYKVEMWVKNKYSDTKTYDDMVRFEIDVRGMASQFEAYNYIGNTNVNSKIKFSAKSDKDALFKFFIKHQNDSNFSVIKDYNEMSSVEWIPRKSGTYMIEMWVKNKQSSTLNYDQKVSFNINIANFEVKDLGFKFDFGLSGPSPNNPNKLVLHHAAGNSTASSVHDFHRFTNGWAGIGYHFYIHKDGTIYKGRDESWRGAHAAEVGPDDGNLNNDTNATSLGIAVQGNYHPTGPTPSNSMPKAQEDAVVKLGRHLVQKYGLTQIFKHGSPGIGHTSCPGDYYPFARIKARILDGFVYGIDSDNLDQVTD